MMAQSMVKPVSQVKNHTWLGNWLTDLGLCKYQHDGPVYGQISKSS